MNHNTFTKGQGTMYMYLLHLDNPDFISNFPYISESAYPCQKNPFPVQ